jgi:hypothetical protein
MGREVQHYGRGSTMLHRGRAALLGTLLVVACAPAAAGASTGVGTAPGDDRT